MRECRSVYLFILQQAWFFSGISLLRKQVSPCLLRALAYKFSGLLEWMQYVKSLCEKLNVFPPKFFVYRRKTKSSETFFRLILSEKKYIYIYIILVTLKCYGLPRKLGKHIKFITFFAFTMDEIPTIFSKSGPGVKPKLALAYYVFPLWMSGLHSTCTGADVRLRRLQATLQEEKRISSN